MIVKMIMRMIVWMCNDCEKLVRMIVQMIVRMIVQMIMRMIVQWFFVVSLIVWGALVLVSTQSGISFFCPDLLLGVLTCITCLLCVRVAE